ncbi:hypothetical protein DXX93_08655 [Thalassotalea euphylliae]|uniref:Uncharacterized protein n=1 Tax=Thalassotalea euphylliae TaxID=1655234 RepID=A0A3E0TPT9_9GAMM|nr:hypothetical protein [Thalassotalea euphylliae]REL26641.1 hypothetical protein DXX93_08655 [Thalassotalea euphylliae]
MMLSEKEKNELYLLISALIGEDESIRARKSAFNQKTVKVVEKMNAANVDCNALVKKLLASLSSGKSLTSNGWLKKSLDALSKFIGKHELKGYGCLVTTKSRWKSAILVSAS